MLGLRETGMLGIEDDLRDAGVIAQVDENQAAVIAAAIDPAVELDSTAFVGGTQLAARNPIGHATLL
jgi:hypothetical protein